MSDAVVTAAIAGGSALAGGSLSQLGTYYLERLRFRQSTRAARVDEARGVIDAGSQAFVDALMALDNALNGITTHIDSTPLFTNLLKRQSAITLLLGSAHPIAAAYREAVERWAEAIGTAVQPPSTARNEALARLRNQAKDAHERFLNAAAPYVGPEAEVEPKKRGILAAPEGDA
jgi:hypothetical protein